MRSSAFFSFALAASFMVTPLVARATGSALGADCSLATDCTSGFCVDGVCCNVACAGSCEACDGTTTLGTCAVVAGAPHGARTCTASGSDAGVDLCAAATCDGVDATSCDAFANGPTVVCASPSCSGSVFSPASHCDGAGHCATAPATTCTPFACGATACKTTCLGNTDCATGDVCSGGGCVPDGGASCSADRTSSIGASGTSTSCAPYLCGSEGTCDTTCTVTTDCVSGFACDTATNQCITSTSNTTTCNGPFTQQILDTTVDCTPYVCDQGACLTACKVDTDCVGGYECGLQQQCVNLIIIPQSDSNEGCAVEGVGSKRGAGGVVLAAMLALSARRRRR